MTNRMTETEAEAKMNSLIRTATALENEALELALEYNLELHTSQGRLILEDGHWTGKGRGEWVTSTDSCS